MDFNKQEIATIQKAIQYWQSEALITTEVANKLQSSVTNKANHKLAPLSIYAFIIAGSSAILAFATLIIDAKWLEKFRQAWSFSELFISIIFMLISIFLVVYNLKNSKKHQFSKLSNETFNIGIFFTICIAVTYLGRALIWDNNYFASEMAIIAALTFTVAFLLKSRLLWLIAWIVATVWFSTQTYLWGNEHYKFLGMNYPLRCSAWSIIILGISALLNRKLHVFKKPTFSFGMITLLIASWSLSIFGNYSSLDKWQAIHQGSLWYWAVGFTIFLLFLFFVAIKTKNDFLRDVSIAFFIINLYTRYFEYFWDKTNKGIFFALLAISFWIIGRQIEKLRNNPKNHKEAV